LYGGLTVCVENTRVNRMVRVLLSRRLSGGMVEQAHGGLTVLRGNVKERRPHGLGRGTKRKAPFARNRAFQSLRVDCGGRPGQGGSSAGVVRRSWAAASPGSHPRLRVLDWDWIGGRSRIRTYDFHRVNRPRNIIRALWPALQCVPCVLQSSLHPVCRRQKLRLSIFLVSVNRLQMAEA
jgi:hypothetical protein